MSMIKNIQSPPPPKKKKKKKKKNTYTQLGMIIFRENQSKLLILSFESDQENLLSNRLKYFILEVSKSANNLNARCLHGMFVIKEVPYDMRTSRLE